MPTFFRHLLRLLFQLGYLGPFVLGAADSSFLFLPVGNDLLIVYLVARRHAEFWIYCLAGALGSTLGVLLVDYVSKRVGETGVKKIAGERRFNQLMNRMNRRGGLLVALAALAPPPFPFTILIATTSVLGYSTRKLLLICFGSRVLRFLAVSLLAIRYGQGILRIVNTQGFKYSAIAFSIICLIVTGLSIAKWVSAARAQRS